MFEMPVESLFVWVALGVVSVAVMGVISAVPSTAPPDATATAATIDEVSTSPPGSVVHRQITADQWTFDGRQLGLRNDGGSAHATLMWKVIPVHDSQLRAVLNGTVPESVFGSPTAFERAIAATARDQTWYPAPDRVTIRRVVWEEIDVTLVG